MGEFVVADAATAAVADGNEASDVFAVVAAEILEEEMVDVLAVVAVVAVNGTPRASDEL
jgi:hypothetical protein